MTNTNEASIRNGSTATVTNGTASVTVKAQNKAKIKSDITSFAAASGVSGGGTVDIATGPLGADVGDVIGFIPQ